jgi:hypothetical protein
VRRAAALLLTGPPAVNACPPGVDPAEFARAMAEDVVDLLAGMADVDVVIAHSPERLADAEAIRWPDSTLLPSDGDAVTVLDGLADRGYEVGAVVVADAPDLPGLVVAKPFSALSGGLVAAAPSTTGGLVILASRLPVPEWLAAERPLDLDGELDVRPPRRRDVRTTPGWHRLRTPADIARLDPNLEGWDATRALLSK